MVRVVRVSLKTGRLLSSRGGGARTLGSNTDSVLLTARTRECGHSSGQEL